jgi:hypothetical protein
MKKLQDVASSVRGVLLYSGIWDFLTEEGSHNMKKSFSIQYRLQLILSWLNQYGCHVRDKTKQETDYLYEIILSWQEYSATILRAQMQAAGPFETLFTAHTTTQCQNPKDHVLKYVVTFSYVLTLWRRSLSKCYLRIQSVPQREHHTSPLQSSTG